MKNRISIFIFSFFLFIPFANAQTYPYGICASGFGDIGKNGTYIEQDLSTCMLNGGSSLSTECYVNNADPTAHLRVYGSRGQALLQWDYEAGYGWNGYNGGNGASPISSSWTVSTGGTAPAGITVSCAAPVVPVVDMYSIIASAQYSMESTTGFNVASTVAWTGDNLIKLFIGSGLAILYLLKGWIVAMVIIGAIIFFSYRAFRFFRH
jgi:hypothetical protein